MTKQVKTTNIGDNGSVKFMFEDSTVAQAFWVSFGPGNGGEYNEDNVEICDSGLTAAQIVELAYKYNG